jgi:hypothetical protein
VEPHTETRWGVEERKDGDAIAWGFIMSFISLLPFISVTDHMAIAEPCGLNFRRCGDE